MPILVPDDGTATPASLFTLDELSSYLKEQVDEERGNLLSTLVGALVSGATGRTYLSGEIVPPVLKAVALSVAGRAYTNPQGYQSETIGGYSYSLPAASQVGLYLTPDERRLVRGAIGRSAVRSVRLIAPSAPGYYP